MAAEGRSLADAVLDPLGTAAIEQLEYNLLFRWFVGRGIDDRIWVPTVFSTNRDRLLDADIARKFLAEVLAHAQVKPLLSDAHFSVDDALVEAWASLKSFRAKDGSDEPSAPPGRNGELHKQTRSNETQPPTPIPTPSSTARATRKAPSRASSTMRCRQTIGQVEEWRHWT